MKLGLLAAVVVMLSVGGASASPTGAPVIGIRFSQFGPRTVTVRVGEPVTFTLRNSDPIDHEWIVGNAEVHERHRTGAEPVHNGVPTEVTVPAYATRLTTVTFARPGEYAFICHLPGHEAYGMRGVVRAVAE